LPSIGPVLRRERLDQRLSDLRRIARPSFANAGAIRQLCAILDAQTNATKMTAP
jgi:hypothetical protein